MSEHFVGALNHIELWVPNLARAQYEWGWLLGGLNYALDRNWVNGTSWRNGGTYIVVEESPDMSSGEHVRTAAGVNHLAFSSGTQQRVDRLAAEGAHHGWTQLFPERYPHAGGPDHYAAYLINSDGFEVELVSR
ncbi:VOC family protein [Arthrobacter sp. UYEF3]|uniref:VOC family protein n=1 Tax=Arthrobacter sp. UYEF3 TaxID=1756365 RepID=UPI003398D1C1